MSKLICWLIGHSYFRIIACDKTVWVSCRRCLDSASTEVPAKKAHSEKEKKVE